MQGGLGRGRRSVHGHRGPGRRPAGGRGRHLQLRGSFGEGGGAGFYRKILLPNYAVFDEKRYFGAGDRAVVLCVDGVRLGLTICEDIWEDDGPGESAVVVGDADMIVNLSMSPYHSGKGNERKGMLAERAKTAGAHILYVERGGGAGRAGVRRAERCVRPRGQPGSARVSVRRGAAGGGVEARRVGAQRRASAPPGQARQLRGVCLCAAGRWR